MKNRKWGIIWGHPELCQPQIPKDRDPWSCLSLERDCLVEYCSHPHAQHVVPYQSKIIVRLKEAELVFWRLLSHVESIQKFLDSLVKKLESNLLAWQSAYQRGYHTRAKWPRGQQQPRPASKWESQSDLRRLPSTSWAITKLRESSSFQQQMPAGQVLIVQGKYKIQQG